jgi:hypothetical protein
MADIREELGLGAINRRQCLGTPSFLLVRLRIGERSGNLPCDQL